MKDVNLLINNGVNVEKSIREVFGDIETYNDTLDVFLNEVEGKLAEMKVYLEKADMPNYAIKVHSLKSDGKYFGFEKLAELSFNHEMESKANNIGYVTEHFEELMSEANRIVNLVKQYVGINMMPNTVSEPQQNRENIISFPSNNMMANTISQPQKEPASIIQFPGEGITNTTSQQLLDNTILVADDSDIVRGFVSNAVHGEYPILGAHDGKEAIDIINANVDNKIVCMLLDLNMPNVDGFQVLEYMQQENLFSQIPVAIITGDILRSSIDRAFQYPIRDMLQKPFNDANIRNVIEKLVMFHNEYSNSNQEEESLLR